MQPAEAVLFDMGGTLDGNGAHWLDRFVELYGRAGLAQLGYERLKEAFYHADRRANRDPEMPELGFYPMIERYTRWQLDYLGIGDGSTFDTLYHGFADPAAALLRQHRDLLRRLYGSGLKLGIISNFCGNIRVICDEFEYSGYLQVTIDSRHAGVAKPDPAIFQLALRELGLPAEAAIYVGDSFERDVVAAKAAGLRAIWVSNEARAPDGQTVEPDAIVATLDELLAALGFSRDEEAAAETRKHEHRARTGAGDRTAGTGGH